MDIKKFLLVSLLLSLCLCLVLMAVQYLAPDSLPLHRSSPSRLFSGRDAEDSRHAELLPGETVDINSADEAQLMLLPGIGQHLAEEIIAYRQAYGPFYCLEELGMVPGLGQIRLENIRPYVSFGGAP